MPTLLLNLRNVPNDEADEVRALMSEHAIEFYETRPSMWGVSAGGIWLTHPEQAPQARRLFADYQQERARRALAEHEQAQREGSTETFLDLLRRQPLRVLAILTAVVLVLALMIGPFLNLGG